MRIICLIFLFFGLPTFGVNAISLMEKRTYYAQSKHALSNNNPNTYLKYAKNLHDYPLTSYLAYEELSLRLKNAEDKEIIDFINNHSDLPQIGWLKLRWLRWLAERENWQDFLTYYSNDGKFTELDCLHAYYQLKLGDKNIGAKQTEKLWLTGKTHHKSCNQTFALWKKYGYLTDNLQFKRLILILNNNDYKLAEEFAKNFTKNTKLENYARLAINVSKNPNLLTGNNFLANHEYNTQIVTQGLSKLAAKDNEQAFTLLKKYENNLNFNNENKLQLARAIGLRMAKNFHPDAYQLIQKYDPKMQNNELVLWRLRLLIAAKNWRDIAIFTTNVPEHIRNSERFKYWHARSLLVTNSNNLDAYNTLKELAKSRSYHGFLAADLIKAPYNFHPYENLPVKASTTKFISNLPAVKRAFELYYLGEFAQARLEWALIIKNLSPKQLESCARLAHQIGWHWAAITAARHPNALSNDLEVLFPTPYKYVVKQKSRLYQIPSNWIYAIMRQESLFVVQAKSRSNAMGLMQVLPSTAKYVAKKHNIDYALSRIFHPELNINLGSVYLKQLHNQFNNRILATASYNAGPNRVKRWLQNNGNLPADAWIEIIPFDETRGYVQNVLTFAVIYGKILGNSHQIITPSEFNIAFDPT